MIDGKFTHSDAPLVDQVYWSSLEHCWRAIKGGRVSIIQFVSAEAAHEYLNTFPSPEDGSGHLSSK